MKGKSWLFVLVLAAVQMFSTNGSAQCSSTNTAFKSGETLSYDLYFNWKFVWVKAGTASMNITQTRFQGKPAFRTYLITRGSKRADHFFVMRDTLMAYNTLNLIPLYYTKRAFEGDTYRRNDVWYSYASNKVTVRMKYRRNSNPPSYKNVTDKYCMFDMLSMMLRARSFNPKNYRVGQRISFIMPDGNNCQWDALLYRGHETFKMENSKITYRCLVFSFMERDKKGKEKEIVRFFITDDRNHLPVRLDMYLNFGTAKAFLTGASGIRNPQTSIIH